MTEEKENGGVAKMFAADKEGNGSSAKGWLGRGTILGEQNSKNM